MKSIRFLLLNCLFFSNILLGYCAIIKVDINNIETPEGSWVVLANGSWNDWGWGTELFDDDGNGSYEGVVCGLADGSYGYVYSITGDFDAWSGWGMVSNAPYNSLCDFFPNDQWHNYGFLVNGEDVATQLNSWGECGLEESFSIIDDLVRPVNGDIVNYIYIPFEWSQIPDAISYNLQVSESEDFDDILLNHSTEKTLFIAKEDFNWNSSYHWRVQAVFDGQDLGLWTDHSTFHIGLNQFDLSSEVFSDNEFLHQYTVFGDWNNYRTVILDIDGKEVWNSGELSFMMNYVSEYGQLFGGRSNGNGVEVDYDEGIVWQSTQWLDQHEFKQISNGNYMGLVHESQLGPIPLGEWTSSFQALGYQADGVTNEFPFFAQKLVEFDADTKDPVWSWNPHDHYSKQDVDLYGGTWWNSFGGTTHDWTHTNAFFFDEIESAAYVSNRHLSRISKIDYPSGEIIWNMGLPGSFMFTGDDHICSDLEFSFQHNIQKLDNGNLLFFDNGNLDYLFGNNMTSRAIEVEVIDNSYCNVVWEYVLPPELAAYGMGSVQSLSNGNYFINTTGDGGTVLEVNPEGDVLWKVNLGLTWPNGSGYRSYRVPSIHPGAFSVKAQNFKTISLNDTTYHAIETNPDFRYVEFYVHNHSGYNQPYDYEFQNINGELLFGTISIDAYASDVLVFDVDEEDISSTSIRIRPRYHPNSERFFTFDVFSNASYSYGDVDSNGDINILDVILIIDFIIGDNHPSENQAFLADINSDNIINILDIIDIVDIILAD